jgi:hypothetical protein
MSAPDASTAPGDTGHVFVVHGDLSRLSCDDVLIPTDSEMRITRGFHGLLGTALTTPEAGGEARVRPEVLTVRADGLSVLPAGTASARRWLVDTVTGDVASLLERVDRFVEAVATDPTQRAPRHGRAKRLLALPLVGTGEGGAAGRRGDVIAAMLPLLQGLTTRHDLDLALVLRDPRDAAAAQEVRRRVVRDWPLTPDLLEAADRLAGAARDGSLALFVGAGVSRAAGLPMWDELLSLLAGVAGLQQQDAAHLAQLAPPDAAQLLYRRLGAARFAQEITRLFERDEHALAHALLAALPVQTAVTTNWDRLLEHAYAGAGRRTRLLPDEPAPAHLAADAGNEPPGSVELVKLHGDVRRPEDIVLTRESYLRLTEEQAALTGVVQALLLTRHMLFVGFSLLDDTFIRIAHQTRRVLQRTQVSAGTAHVGTVLALRDDPVRRELWEQDLNFLSLSPAGTPLPVAARRLEVFLDRVASGATAQYGWLLDPRYSGLRTAADDELARALTGLSGGPSALRESPAWDPVQRLLRDQLGGTPPMAPPGDLS